MNAPSNVQDEAGSTDDRLSLSVASYPFIEDWEDGKRYKLTIEVDQLSPGEFNVVTAEPQGEAEGQTSETETEGGEEEEMPMKGPMRRNPAVDAYMSGPKA